MVFKKSHLKQNSEQCHFLLSPKSILFLFYLFGVIARFALSLTFRHGPTVQIDESLYINIAKSLAAGEGIAYRSQPVPYMYILYPLLLVPLYLFPLPFDLYRVAQFYNALLITASIFPVYWFSKDFTGNRKKALLASFLTLLMPDMIMSGFLMSESVVWPLSLWLIFFSYRLFKTEDKNHLYGIPTGLCTALLFWTKPGSCIMGIVLLLCALFLGDSRQLKKRRIGALFGCVMCAACIFFFYCLYTLVFGYDFSILGLYKKQLTEVSLKWLAAVAEFSILQLFLFAVACGGIFFIIPYAYVDVLDKNRKSFLSAFSIGLAVLAFGTAAFVDMHSWNGSFINPQLHLRYMAMYIPVMIVFTLGANFSSDLLNRKKLLPLLVMALLILFPSPSIGFAKADSTYMDSIALSAWLGDLGVPVLAGKLLSVFYSLFLVILSLLLWRGKQFASLLKYSLLFLVAFFLCNNIFAYRSINSHKDKSNYGPDAVEINQMIEALPQEVLIVTQQQYNETASYCLESRLRKPMQQVPEDIFINTIAKSGGTYHFFIPADQDPNVGNHLTPDTDTFLFGVTVDQHVEFSDTADIQKSGQGWFTLVKVPAGQRIVDTALSGLDVYSLPEDVQAQFYVFDESLYKNGKLTLHLIAHAKGNSANLEIENTGKTESIALSEKEKTCLISLRPGDTTITARGGDVEIVSYWAK